MIWSFIAAFVTGILASLGVGGGMLLIIYLTVFAGFDQLSAQGINLLYFLPIALLAVILHTKNKLINWKPLIPAILAGIIGAVIGSIIAKFIDKELLRTVFAVFVLVIGVKEILYKKQDEKMPIKYNTAVSPKTYRGNYKHS
ncbi:MAG: sulfite exporter TauE/SafE family protein [Ruminococcus sp.]|jgi:uncharacterized membrane protein YfcA|nr:sulfite exporter TauE/SafE family protein [Ruminococcus sp.]